MGPVSCVHQQRLAAQLLSGAPARTPLEVVQHLLAVQGQDPRGARLTIRARSTGLTTADVDRALTDDRSLIITWLNRGTLHLVRTEDYWWLQALTTPQLSAGSARRLMQEGVSPDAADRGVLVIERSLAANGPLTRGQLRERVQAAGVRVAGQALVHILLLASIRGLVVRGPMVGAEQAFVLVRDWLGAPPVELDRERALAELARRYLVGHGPATDRDLARWAGLPLRDVRRGIRGIAPLLEQREDGLADLRGRPAAEPVPPRLLGAFDPLLLGWVSREPVVGAYQGIVTSNGVFRPFALASGRAVGTWSLVKGRPVLAPFGELTSSDAQALELDAVDVRRFLAGEPSAQK